MIKCKEAVDRLWSYLDRNLAQVEEQELQAHLGLCRHCCGELEFARQLRGLLVRPGDAAELPSEARLKLDAFLKGLGEKP